MERQQQIKFHRIPGNFVQIQSSMEIQGTFDFLEKKVLRIFSKFHGIPQNSMKFDKNLFTKFLKKIKNLRNVYF